jgi:hypothetical protein
MRESHELSDAIQTKAPLAETSAAQDAGSARTCNGRLMGLWGTTGRETQSLERCALFLLFAERSVDSGPF